MIKNWSRSLWGTMLLALSLVVAIVPLKIASALTPTPTPSNTPEPTTIEPTLTPTLSAETLEFAPEDPIRIGYMLWESHPLGVDMKRGMEIALADLGGELLGHPLELTGFDSECTELGAQRAAQILVRDDSVVGIIGPTCSRGALRAAPIVTDGGRVLISPSSSSPELTAPESRAAGFFRTSPNDLSQVIAVAQYAYDELGARKLATVYAASEKLQKLQSEFLCSVFTELGGECVVERTMEAGSTYMPPIINTLIENPPDVIYFMGWAPQEGAAFLAAARETPELENTALFVWGAYNTPNFLSAAGENAVGVYVSTTTYEFDRESDAYYAFYDSYMQTYGEEPSFPFHAHSYDAVTLLLKAVELVAIQNDDGSLTIDPLAVRDAMYLIDSFSGLTGTIACDLAGDCADSSEGEIYQFTSGDPETFNPGPAESLSSNPALVWP